MYNNKIYITTGFNIVKVISKSFNIVKILKILKYIIVNIHDKNKNISN